MLLKEWFIGDDRVSSKRLLHLFVSALFMATLGLVVGMTPITGKSIAVARAAETDVTVPTVLRSTISTAPTGISDPFDVTYNDQTTVGDVLDALSKTKGVDRNTVLLEFYGESYVVNKLWTLSQFMSYYAQVMGLSDSQVSEFTATFGSDPFKLKGQAIDEQATQKLFDQKVTYDGSTSPFEVDLNVPLTKADISMKITYKMADGSNLPASVTDNADSSDGATATRVVTGYDGQVFNDKHHFLIPEISGYTANPTGITFDSSKVGADGNQDVTITYSKPTTATSSPNKPTKSTKPTSRVAFKVYAKRGLNRYRNADFKRSERVQGYAKKAKAYAPIFSVVKTVTSKAGNQRYELADGTYITANADYVGKLYWSGHYNKLFVTNPKGTNVYSSTTFTNKVRHLKQGAAVAVTKVVKQGLTTRYELADGTYITGNKQWVSPTKPTMVTKVKATTKINRYQTVNLKKRIKSYKKGSTITVKGWDYSHGDRPDISGTKRYRVAGGYITANPRLVHSVK